MYYLFLLIPYLFHTIFNYFKPRQYHKQKPKETKETFVPYAHPHKNFLMELSIGTVGHDTCDGHNR